MPLLRSVVSVAVLTAAPACLDDLTPIERDAGEAGVTIEVVGCELDDVTGNVTETIELTSEREYVTVVVDFKLKDAEGTIVATTSTSASNVQPGETYRLSMPLSPSGELGLGFTCEADLNLVTEPIG